MMHKKFHMSSMGELTFFLGLQVKQKEDGIFISQDKYVTEILKKFSFSDVKTASTPMETHKPLLKDADGEDIDEHMYRSMIGSLMYLTSSRPDIMFVVCVCARFQVNLKVSHLHVVKRIFRYLKGQPKLGLWYPKDSPFDLVAYTDSDYAGESLDRKSTVGEAEYVAASSCCGQVLWIKNQLLDYGYNLMHTKIYIDNESTICIVKNPVFHSKTKHIEIRHHFIRDSNDKKLIQMIKIHIDKNVADLLTKAFDARKIYIELGSTSGIRAYRETLNDIPPPPPPQTQTPTQQTPHTVSTIKLPILKKGELFCIKLRRASEGLHKGYDRFQSPMSQLEIHGTGISTKDANQKFLRSLPSAWSQVSLIMRTKPGVDNLSFDDLYNNLRVFESDVKGSTASSSSTHNVAFVFENTSSTNDVSTAYDVSNSSGHNSQCANPLSYSFLANQSSCPQLDHEDLKQLDEFDWEEIDLKWQMAMISMRMNKFYKNTGRKLQFDAKEPVDSRRKDAWNTRNKDKGNGRRSGKQEESKALVTLDGDGVDWTSHSEDEQENYALMAYSNSGSDTKMSARDKAGLGYGDQMNKGVLSYENEVFGSLFNSSEETLESMPEPVVNESNVVSQPKAWSDALIIEEYESDTVLTRTGRIPVNTARTSSTNNVNTARHHFNSQAVPTNAARKVYTVKPIVNNVRPKTVFQKTYSPIRRPFDRTTASRTKFSNQKVNTAEDYPQRALKNKGIVDSGCSRHMTRNKAYLAEYQDFNGGPVAFEVVKMCDKKNKVLFTDTECLVLSPDFKLPDENQVLLRVPIQNNMYSFNLENIVPSGGLACLIAKATVDESNKCHRRLGHVNFKNLNKLVKGNLVRGLPSKIFQNDHSCVACQKGKQHKASCKAKSVSSISQSLQLLHMDLFGPTSVRSLKPLRLCPLLSMMDFCQV
ncbi:ribonuclease H-like domain-containing protein [Tanacetum coccineum]